MSIETARGIGDDAAAALDKEIEALMERALVRFLPLVSALDIDPNGRIKSTAANVERINGILDRMSALLFDNQYMAVVADYLESMNRVSGAVSSSMVEFGADEEVLKAIARQSKAAVASALLSPSSFRGLFAAISEQLVNGIATGASIVAVSDGIKQVMKQ